jgi:hypothetical protein
MDAQLKQQWIDALRSGKYQQAKHKLKGEDGFCCLGVLCDVYDPNSWGRLEEIKDDVFGYNFKGFSPALPPDALCKGFPDENPTGMLPFRSRFERDLSLTILNDSGEFTFDQIADVIQYFF